MWSSRLFWKLFLIYAGLNLTLAIGFWLFVSHWQRTQVLAQVEQRLDNVTVALAQSATDPSRISQAATVKLGRDTGLRLTIVAANGQVLADSEENPQRMENHLQRPEIQQALREGRGAVVRRSTTTRQPTYYVARAIVDEGRPAGFIRAGKPLASIESEVASIQIFVWSFATFVGLSAVLVTYLVVRRIIRPLAQLAEGSKAAAKGDYSRRVQLRSRDELGLLADAFNYMQQELATQVSLLRENGELLQTVLGSMVEGVLAVDAHQRVLFANDASRSLLEIGDRDVQGRLLLEASRNRAVHDAVAEVLRRRAPFVSEFETGGSPRRAVALRATPLPGSPTPGVVVVLHDVTELRRLENLRREFVANVSHELKTPLASIKAYSETLRMGAMDDPEHNVVFLARIEEQAERLHQLIVDLLHLARVESGKEAFDIVDVPVADVVAGICGYFHEAAEAKNITLVVDAPSDPVRVRADEEGLRTILDNLVNNAIKYTPEQGQVVMRWRSEQRHGVIEVEDNGIGIAPHDQGRVFERFYRVDKARSREMGGTGLGLAIVKHLAQAFGGSVGLWSELGQGSRFQVRIPLAGDAVSQSRRETPAATTRTD